MEQTKQNEEFKRYKIPNTPFQIHQDLEGKHLLLGSYKIAPNTFKTDEDVDDYLTTNFYDVILTLILVANDYTNATKKNDTNQPVSNNAHNAAEIS